MWRCFYFVAVGIPYTRTHKQTRDEAIKWLGVEGGVDDGNYSDGGEEKGEDEGEDEDEDEDEDTSKLRPDKENRVAVRSRDAVLH